MGWKSKALYLVGMILFVAQFGRIFTSKTHMTDQSVLLVTAHPDDETMFFGPTLTHVLKPSRHNKLRLLVLSNGDSAGLGTTRTAELKAAAKSLGIGPDQVAVVDDPRLPDAMDVSWDPEVVAQYVARELEDHGVQTVITFDETGVSGHPNHRAVHLGTLMAAAEHASSHDDFSMLTLFSVPLWRKYLFSMDSVLSRIITIPGVQYHLIGSQTDYHWTRLALRKHESQMVWYRHLWSFFSRYMVVNDLSEVNFGRALRSVVFQDEEKQAKLEAAIEKPLGTEGTNKQRSAVKPSPTKDRAVTRQKPQFADASVAPDAGPAAEQEPRARPHNEL